MKIYTLNKLVLYKVNYLNKYTEKCYNLVIVVHVDINNNNLLLQVNKIFM